jgi:hypothetical protein
MMKRIILSFVLAALVIFFTAGCGKQVFNGSSTGNDTQFLLDYSILNCTKTHEMKLKEGTNINVIIESSSGRVDILVVGSNGDEIYRGDNASSGEFALKIPKSDTYKFSVTGSDAKGSVSFKTSD